jgi:hypothetical protein
MGKMLGDGRWEMGRESLKVEGLKVERSRRKSEC